MEKFKIWDDRWDAWYNKFEEVLINLWLGWWFVLDLITPKEKIND